MQLIDQRTLICAGTRPNSSTDARSPSNAPQNGDLRYVCCRAWAAAARQVESTCRDLSTARRIAPFTQRSHLFPICKIEVMVQAAARVEFRAAFGAHARALQIFGDREQRAALATQNRTRAVIVY